MLSRAIAPILRVSYIFLRRKLVQILKQIACRPSSDGNPKKTATACHEIAKELSVYGTPKPISCKPPTLACHHPELRATLAEPTAKLPPT